MSDEMPVESTVSIPVQPVEVNERPFLIRASLGALISIGVLLVGALIWGVVSFATDSVYFFIPILVGFAITAGLFYPFKRVSFLVGLALFLPCIVLTVVSALLGDCLYYTLILANEYDLNVGEAAVEVALNLEYLLIEGSDTGMSVVLSIIGAILGFIRAVRK